MDLAAGAFRPARTRRVLDNGLIVLALERRHLPTISATLLLPAGTAAEPEDRPGVAFFTSLVLPMGTGHRSAVELAEEIDGLGATLAASCDHDYSTVEVTGLTRNACEILDILADVVLDPAFTAEEIERRRSQILGILQRRKDDYAEVVRSRFTEAIYGAHPYRRMREGAEDSVRAMARDDLLAFYEGHYCPAGTILALVGDLEAEAALGWVEERFGRWDRPAAPPAPMPQIPSPERRKVVEIQEEVAQAYIRIGNVGFERNHPDYPAAAVMNYILGGAGFGSRLMRRLREEEGLTYGVHSGFHVRRQPGCFLVVTQTGIETMNVALREMLAEIARFLDEGVTEEELIWAKKFLTGSLPLTLETNDQIAQKLLEQEFFGLKEEFWLEDLKRIQAVTRLDVLEVARRHIHPDRFAIVVLADFRKRALDRSFAQPEPVPGRS